MFRGNKSRDKKEGNVKAENKKATYRRVASRRPEGEVVNIEPVGSENEE